MSCRAGCYVFKCWLDHKPAGWPAINTLSQLKWSLTVYAIVSLFCSSSNISTRIPRMVKSLVSFLLFWKVRGSNLSWTLNFFLFPPPMGRWVLNNFRKLDLYSNTMSYVISEEFLLIKHLARKHEKDMWFVAPCLNDISVGQKPLVYKSLVLLFMRRITRVLKAWPFPSLLQECYQWKLLMSSWG